MSTGSGSSATSSSPLTRRSSVTAVCPLTTRASIFGKRRVSSTSIGGSR